MGEKMVEMTSVFVVISLDRPFDDVIRDMRSVGFMETARRECLRTLSGKIPNDKLEELRVVSGVFSVQVKISWIRPLGKSQMISPEGDENNEDSS